MKILKLNVTFMILSLMFKLISSFLLTCLILRIVPIIFAESIYIGIIFMIIGALYYILLEHKLSELKRTLSYPRLNLVFKRCGYIPILYLVHIIPIILGISYMFTLDFINKLLILIIIELNYILLLISMINSINKKRRLHINLVIFIMSVPIICLIIGLLISLITLPTLFYCISLSLCCGLFLHFDCHRLIFNGSTRKLKQLNFISIIIGLLLGIIISII
jgi:hypothetical protein